MAWILPRHDHMWVPPSHSASAQTLPATSAVPWGCPGLWAVAQAGRRALWASKGMQAGTNRRAGAGGRVLQLGWPHPCCLQLGMDLHGWGVQAGLQPLPQPEHPIHIPVTVFGHLCFSWQCQSSRTAGKSGKWTALAMSLLLQLSQRSLLVVLSHVCSKQS